jgi:hypothetical protein
MFAEKTDWARYFLLRQFFPNEAAWRMAKRPPTIEELQEMYDFTYYSSMNAAVTDVNNGTIGTNADATKDTAVAGVYTDQGKPYVVLLKDATEATRIKPSVDMTINLGGHTYFVTDRVAIGPQAGNIIIDGRLNGSTVRVENADKAWAIQAEYDSNVEVNGGQYIANATGGKEACIMLWDTAKLTIKDATIIATDTTNPARGVAANAGTTASIYNCTIRAIAADGEALGVLIKDGGVGIISNCDIRAYSNYTTGGESYYEAFSQGIQNYGSLTINDCNVMGTHSGMQNNGTLYVNGGTYESYGHGGIYFGTGTATAYVRNATLKDMLTMPDGYEATSSHNGAAFYIGGSAEADNIKVYMDNCDLYGSGNQGTMRGGSGEENNSLYISNSRLHKLGGGNTIKFRLDGGNHTIYIGTGNNFTEANVEFTDRETDLQNPSHVVVTDEVYTQ